MSTRSGPRGRPSSARFPCMIAVVRGAFITGTGTNVGKTRFAVALTGACAQRGYRTVAIKPIETGSDPEPEDAIALAKACRNESLTNAAGLYRARERLAPYAIAKRGGKRVGSLRELARRTEELGRSGNYLIVEGIGDVLTPLDDRNTVADLVACLDLLTIVVTRNERDAVSRTLSATEALHRRKVAVRAVVLMDLERRWRDPHRELNRSVLADHLTGLSVFRASRSWNATSLASTALQVLDAIAPKTISRWGLS